MFSAEYFGNNGDETGNDAKKTPLFLSSWFRAS